MQNGVDNQSFSQLVRQGHVAAVFPEASDDGDDIESLSMSLHEGGSANNSNNTSLNVFEGDRGSWGVEESNSSNAAAVSSSSPKRHSKRRKSVDLLRHNPFLLSDPEEDYHRQLQQQQGPPKGQSRGRGASTRASEAEEMDEGSLIKRNELSL